MSSRALLDTGFLISLVDRRRPHHEAARNYYKYFLQHQVPMLLPTVVACEFSIVQPITDLPLRNFRVLPFNLTEATKCADLNAHHYRQQLGGLGQRDAVKDDFKIIAQAVVQQATHLVTEDEATICRYCDSLQTAGKIQLRIVKLSAGFNESFVNGGQQGLDLSEARPS